MPDRKRLTVEEEWKALAREALDCQSTWGMGFPVISLRLLKPFWERALHAAAQQAREEAAETAKREIMVRAKAKRMGAGLHDPDGSVFGEFVARAIRARSQEESS